MNELELTPTQTARIAALSAAINPKDAAAVLHNLKLAVIGGELIAMASDRYSLTEYRTPTDAPHSFAFYLNQDALKFAADSAKAKLGLTITADSGMVELRNETGSRFGFVESTQQFPDVAPMIDKAKERADERAGISYRLSAKRLELLTKLGKAFSKDAAYEVSASPETERKTASPILYQLRAAELGSDSLAVLIQPLNYPKAN